MNRRDWRLVLLAGVALAALGVAVLPDSGRIMVYALYIAVFGALGMMGMLMRGGGEPTDAEPGSPPAGAERLLSAIDQAPVGLALYDASGHLDWCNAAYRRALGARGEALMPGDIRPDIPGSSDGSEPRVGQTTLEAGGTVEVIFDSRAERAAEIRARAGESRLLQYLSAAAGWIWETDVLHRVTLAAPVRAGVDASELDWMVGRGIADILARASDGIDEAEEAYEFCVFEMSRHGRLRDLTLWLHDGSAPRKARICGIPRFDDMGTFLGYRGVGNFLASPPAEADIVPRGPAAEPAPLDIAPASEPIARAPVPRLLLVEDSKTNRMLAVSILQRMGYAVDAVENGKMAVAAVANGGYDGVLMDVWMPVMDGLEATRAIRVLDEPLRGIPIIAMTAHVDDENRQRCLAAGMDEHVAKPIDRRNLAAVLRRLVGAPERGPVSDHEANRPPAVTGLALVDDAVIAQLRADAGDALVSELIGAYRGETEERLRRMAAVSPDDGLDAIAADAHALKSSSGTFGALRLQALAADIEARATAGDVGARDLVAQLPALIAETWREFSRRGLPPDPGG